MENQKKSNQEIVRIICMIILITVVILAILLLSRFYIIHQYNKSQMALKEIKEYSYSETTYSSNGMENGISIMAGDNKIIQMLNKDGLDTVVWKDLLTQEKLLLIPKQKVALVGGDYNILDIGIFPTTVLEQKTIGEEIAFSFKIRRVRQEIFNEKEAYFVELTDDTRIWLEKDTFLPMRKIEKKWDEISKKNLDMITEYTYYLIPVEDVFMSKPDLTEYNIQKFE